MGNIATWGPKSFVVDGSKIIPLSGLKITQAVKTETQTSSGNSVANIKGKDALNVSFTTTYLVAAGVDPHAQLDEWLSLVGQAHPLYIGGKRIGPQKLTLQNVEVSNTRHTNSGDFLGIDVAITLKEYATEQTTKSSKGNSKKASDKKKYDAINATAGSADRASHNPRAGRGITTREAVLRD